MNVIEFNPKWRTHIAFCLVDNTRSYTSGICELVKNQADGVLANVYNKGYPVYQWIDEDVLIRHVASLGYTHAVVVSTGTEFINGSKFFDALDTLIQEDFLVAGHVLDRKDAYYELHHQCYVVNLFHYNMLGQPSVGKQELGAHHIQVAPYRTTNTYHDDYTPRAVVAGDFYKQLSWAYKKLNYCQNTFVHTSNTETVNLPIKQYKQIVTPASGVWFIEYLAPDTRVVMYDYNDSSLAYWKDRHPEYIFVKCNLLSDDNLVDYIDPTIEDTLINISNIFNYEGTVFFYSLEYRKYKENNLIANIRSAMPNAEVYCSLHASPFDTIPTWHL